MKRTPAARRRGPTQACVLLPESSAKAHRKRTRIILSKGLDVEKSELLGRLWEKVRTPASGSAQHEQQRDSRPRDQVFGFFVF